MRGQIKVIEWTPAKWWIVQVTGADGSLTPLAGPFTSLRRADEMWAAGEWPTDLVCQDCDDEKNIEHSLGNCDACGVTVCDVCYEENHAYEHVFP